MRSWPSAGCRRDRASRRRLRRRARRPADRRPARRRRRPAPAASARLNGGTLAANSVLVIVRLADTRTSGRVRTTSRSPTLVVLLIAQHLAGGAGFAGRRQPVALAVGELVADRADGAAQRALDPLRHGGEIGFAVERGKNGAAHQGRAADAGQDRAGKPLHRNAAAIDDAAGAAIDRKRRLVAEIDGRIRSGSVCARPGVIQTSSPLHSRSRLERTQDTAASIDPMTVESRRRHDAVALASRSMTGTGERLGSLATLNGAPLGRPDFPIASKNVRGMWLKCGAQAQGGEPVKNGLNTGIAGNRCSAQNRAFGC